MSRYVFIVYSLPTSLLSFFSPSERCSMNYSTHLGAACTGLRYCRSPLHRQMRHAEVSLPPGATHAIEGQSVSSQMRSSLLPRYTDPLRLVEFPMTRTSAAQSCSLVSTTLRIRSSGRTPGHYLQRQQLLADESTLHDPLLAHRKSPERQGVTQ